MKIAIDTGHGSDTIGKRTPDGYKEHWANVGVAYLLETELIRCGFTVIKTGWDDSNSKDDPDTTLSVRQKAIKAAGCELSVSIHFNAFGDGKTYNSGEGVCTYYHSVASKDSKALAECVQSELIKGTKQKDRGVKQNSFAMVNCNAMGTNASILCELAFMTNDREAELMADEKFWEEAAVEIARGVCKYVGVKYVEKTTPAAPVQARPSVKKCVIVNTKEDNLNCRKAAAADSDILGRFKKGAKLELITKEKDWYKVKGKSIEGKTVTGYCSAELLKDDVVAPAQQKKKYAIVNTESSNIYCRSKANKNGSILGRFKKGAKLELISMTNDSWWKVSGSELDSGKKIVGYCFAELLKEV